MAPAKFESLGVSKAVSSGKRTKSERATRDTSHLRLIHSPHWEIDYFKSSQDASRIRFGRYTTSKKVKHWIILLNGRSEWIEKYSFIPEELELDESWGYLSLDHRGQGYSDGETAHIDSYDTFVSDLSDLIHQNIIDSQSYSFLAHSMGGLIALYGTLKGQFHPSAMVLCSPLLRLPDQPMRRSLIEALALGLAKSPWAKAHTPIGSKEKLDFHNNPLTHSYPLFKAMLTSPHKPKPPTFQWIAATADATHYVWSAQPLSQLRCPTLVLCGGQETVVNAEGFALWTQRCQEISQTPLGFIRIPQARHELLYEIPRYRKTALGRARQWLLANRSSSRLTNDIV